MIGMRALALLGLTGLLVTAGCSASDEATDESASATREDGRPYAFTYANPRRPYTAAQRVVLQAALGKLDRVAARGVSPVRRALAAETLARIEAGDVRLGSVGSALGIDRFHMCKDFAMPACRGPAPADDDTTWTGDAALGRKLEDELDGYQWGNRIYFTISGETDPDDLAKTLVHEVNHVANRSECSYYADVAEHVMDGDKAFLEEFRAYVAECYFVKDGSADVDACTGYAAKILDEVYGFEHDLRRIVPRGAPAVPRSITELVVATASGASARLGRLVPEARHWPAAFGACPAR